MKKNPTKRTRILKHLGNVGMALVTVSLMSYPGFAAADPAEVAGQVTGSEGGRAAAKEAINGALKFAKSKPAMTTATGIVCLACIPVAGASASAGMCVACGILIAKTFG